MKPDKTHAVAAQIEANINLESYSSSVGFLGFCNSIIGWGDERCINALIEIIDLFVPNPILVSSLRIYSDLQVDAEMFQLNQNEVEVRNRLIDRGVILLESSDDINDGLHFEATVSDSILKDFVFYQTSMGGLSYHGFISSPEVEMILYPHDDCGLGFIICNESHREYAVNRLQNCSERYSEFLEFFIDG